MRIASRIWQKQFQNRFYVAQVPSNGSDWGYTEDRTKALQLSLYWQRRFLADMRRVNAISPTIS